jgi:hypothetical protein
MEINSDENQIRPGSLESIVTEIWESILGNKPIPADVDFLDAGGDSIMALIIAERVYQMYAVDIPLPMFFEYMTISEMVNVIDEGRGSTEANERG